MVVSRWLVAEQSVFAARAEGRLVVARSPAAVVQALCALPPAAPVTAGTDLTLTFAREVLGREGTLTAALLGLGAETRLAFAIEGDRLVPRGLSGPIAAQGRLAAAAPSQALLDLVPADAGVVLLASLQLPEPLDKAALQAHLAGAWKGKTATRTVALVWNPRGDERQPTEVALAWPERDAALLDEAFTGPNKLERRRACGHVVLASTGALGQAMQQACSGKAPSIRHGPPAVVAGLAAPASLGLGVNLGLVLSRLTGEAWVGEQARAQRPHPRRPRRRLEPSRRGFARRLARGRGGEAAPRGAAVPRAARDRHRRRPRPRRVPLVITAPRLDREPRHAPRPRAPPSVPPSPCCCSRPQRPPSRSTSR